MGSTGGTCWWFIPYSVLPTALDKEPNAVDEKYSSMVIFFLSAIKQKLQGEKNV
jgi:hypothetical protein